ncbi:MAG TPA: FAD-dependent oxidoreductase [Puia sp.]|jgi:ferredoxin-NADP reductase|nr:FAD-dependent oxidoreductase [Puia sp.]
MLQPWQTGKVIRIEQEAALTRRFWIQLPGLASFDFEPGQFVTLDLPIHEKPNKRVRSYSIASWPDGTNVIELVIVLLEGGAGTNYLFNQVTVGSELTLRGPQGVFTLPEPIEKDLFFICTGTGIAPFRAMSHHILNHSIPHREIFLIFGCRQFSDCLYRRELTELAEKIPAFHYIPTFSREDPETAGPLVRTGYVHAIYEELCKLPVAAAGAQSLAGAMGQPLAGTKGQQVAGAMMQSLAGAMQPQVPGEMTQSVADATVQQVADVAAQESLRPANFFLCGWKNMIDEAKQRILALGYDRKSIHQELYG